jgi:hypothetical protein
MPVPPPHGHAVALGDARDRLFREANVVRQREVAERARHVHEVVHDPAAILERGLCGGGVEAPVDLDRVAAHDLPAEPLGEEHGERALAGSGGSQEGEEAYFLAARRPGISTSIPLVWSR